MVKTRKLKNRKTTKKNKSRKYRQPKNNCILNTKNKFYDFSKIHPASIM